MMKELSLVRNTILTKMLNKTTESKESESSNHLMKRGKRGLMRAIVIVMARHRKVAMMTNTRLQRMLRSIADANVKGMPRMRFSWTMVRLWSIIKVERGIKGPLEGSDRAHTVSLS